MVLFGFSLYQLFNANIYFDSERIINELEVNNFDLRIVDDNNLIFLGVTFDDSLSYQDFKDINDFHTALKNTDYVNRLFSVINDKKIIFMGLFPMVKKTMNLSSEESYQKSLQYISNEPNNFITSDTRNLLFLIEASPIIQPRNKSNKTPYMLQRLTINLELFLWLEEPLVSYILKRK